jgi:hypothetical protein
MRVEIRGTWNACHVEYLSINFSFRPGGAGMGVSGCRGKKLILLLGARSTKLDLTWAALDIKQT